MRIGTAGHGPPPSLQVGSCRTTCGKRKMDALCGGAVGQRSLRITRVSGGRYVERKKYEGGAWKARTIARPAVGPR